MAENDNTLAKAITDAAREVGDGLARWGDPTPILYPLETPSEDRIYALRTGWNVHREQGPRELSNRHAFFELEGFVEWIRRWSPVPKAVQILANLPTSPFFGEENVIEAGIDPRDLGGDSVVCVLAFDPTFAAWVEATGKAMDHRGFHLFLREWGHAVADQTTRTSMLGTLEALRVTTETSLEADMTAAGRVKVSGSRGDVKVDQELPGEINLRMPIYDTGTGLTGLYDVRALLIVDAGPQGLRISIKLPAIESTLGEANAAVVSYLRHKLGDAFLVARGRRIVKEVPGRGRFGAVELDYESEIESQDAEAPELD